MRSSLSKLAALAVLFAPASAWALDHSSRGPFFVQLSGGPGGAWTLDTNDLCTGGCPSFALATAALDLGWHVTGRHDGLSVGLRQNVFVAGGAIAMTSARVGYDLAIPLRDYELTIAPFVAAGFAYDLNVLANNAFAATLGVEGRLFFPSTKGLYLLVRPFEVDAFLGNSTMVGVPTSAAFVVDATAGVGYAF